jgi:hypothetical protein
MHMFSISYKRAGSVGTLGGKADPWLQLRGGGAQLRRICPPTDRLSKMALENHSGGQALEECSESFFFIIRIARVGFLEVVELPAIASRAAFSCRMHVVCRVTRVRLSGGS